MHSCMKAVIRDVRGLCAGVRGERGAASLRGEDGCCLLHDGVQVRSEAQELVRLLQQEGHEMNEGDMKWL